MKHPEVNGYASTYILGVQLIQFACTCTNSLRFCRKLMWKCSLCSGAVVINSGWGVGVGVGVLMDASW